MKDSNKIDNKAPIIAMVGISRYMLKDRSAKDISVQAISIIDQYLQSIEDSSLLNAKHKPFKLNYLEEALLMCVRFHPLFEKYTVQFERKFSATFLVGQSLVIFSEILKALSLIAQVQVAGQLKIIFDCDDKQKRLRVYFRGSHLLPKDQGTIRQLFSNNDLEIPTSDKLSIDFDTVVLHYHPVAKKINISANQFPYLYKITGQQEDLIVDILETIMDSVPLEMENLNQAYSAKELQNIGEIAHKMKPNFKNIERHDIADLLQEIEQNAISNDTHALKLKIKKFQKVAPLAIKDLEKFAL